MMLIDDILPVLFTWSCPFDELMGFLLVSETCDDPFGERSHPTSAAEVEVASLENVLLLLDLFSDLIEPDCSFDTVFEYPIWNRPLFVSPSVYPSIPSLLLFVDVHDEDLVFLLFFSYECLE